MHAKQGGSGTGVSHGPTSSGTSRAVIHRAQRSACMRAQVHESGRLRAALAAALRVGNAINQGTHLGGAAAVRLESLLRMADLRVGTSAAPHARVLHAAEPIWCGAQQAWWVHAGDKGCRQQSALTASSGTASRSRAGGGPSHQDAARGRGLGAAGTCAPLTCWARGRRQQWGGGTQCCSTSGMHGIPAPGAVSCWGRCKAPQGAECPVLQLHFARRAGYFHSPDTWHAHCRETWQRP